jgi:hypothetical protein
MLRKKSKFILSFNYCRGGVDLSKLDDDTKREITGKRFVCDRHTGKMKEVDAYDRPDGAKKKVDSDKVRAMLSSNVEQSIIPADISKQINILKV